MITDEILYRTLMRTAASARRIPIVENDGKGSSGQERERERLPRGGGYGHILELLSTCEGLCQQQIASLAGIRPQSVSEAIGVMEARGLIRKESGVEDRRTVLIYLTSDGEDYRQRAAQERKIRAQKLLLGLSEDEKEQLYGLLKKIQKIEKEDSL